MIALHCIWWNDCLHLWGEAPGRKPSGSTTDERPCDRAEWVEIVCPAHPFALTASDLHEAVGDLTPDGLLASIAGESSLALWLPHDASGPLPSISFDGGANASDAGADVQLQARTVPTLTFAPADAFDLLASLSEPIDPTCGVSVRYWHKLARFVRDLLVAQQFVPDLAEATNDTATTAWQPVVTDKQLVKSLEQLAALMPPVCLAVASAQQRRVEPRTLVESFVGRCVDHVIRRNLQQDPFFEQIHERCKGDAPPEVCWLSALISETGTLQLPADELSALRTHVHAWIGRVDGDSSAVPARLCFELLEPQLEPALVAAAGEEEAPGPAPDSTWRLRFRLEAQDGSGESIDAAEIWKDAGAAPGLLRRRRVDRREEVLSQLDRAAQVYPPLEQALHQSAPTGVELSSLQAHEFLRSGAALLEARGFGLRLPEWAVSPQRRLGLRLRIRPTDERSKSGISAPAGRLGLSSIVDFEWQVAVGDDSLTRAQFEQIEAQGAPLVRLNGAWIQFDVDAAHRAAVFLEQQRSGRMTLLEALRHAGGAEELDVGLPVVGLDGTAWLDRLLGASPVKKTETIDQPDDFIGQMRPYQLRGLCWLVFLDRIGIGACLADDMGLGKTIQLIALLLHERSLDEPLGPSLIFAPTSVIGNWYRELERFAPNLRVMVHHGQERLVGDEFIEAAKSSDAVITTYALGHRDLKVLSRLNWHRIVLDEAQKIKNPSAAQTVAIRSLISPRRVALTGTPLENHLSELWSIMEMLNPGLLGSAGDFRKKFAVPVERLGDSRRAEQLKRMIHPFLLRRVKNDPDVECDLPEKMEMRVYCNLTPEQAALYEHVVAQTLDDVDSASGIRRRGLILAALTKLKQVCNHPVHYLRTEGGLVGRSGKCDRLIEMLEEAVAEGDAALVFTQFREMGDLLVRLIVDRLHTNVLFLHGGSTAKQRTAMIDRFQDPAGNAPIFVLSLRAGGLGLNLTRANHVFHFDRWWNPAVEDQATDRAHRIGQTRRVQVHKFVCIGTIEDRIDRMLTEKLALADKIVGSGDEWITGLSTDQLRTVLTLSREAIG